MEQLQQLAQEHLPEHELEKLMHLSATA